MDSLDYKNLSNSVGVDILSSSSSSISTVSLSDFSFETREDDSSQNLQGCNSCSMSLSSLMHTESLLQKQLPVVHGGSHVELTKKDLMRIRDPKVLEFFERNSSIFGKYVKKSTSKSETQIILNKNSFLSTISDVDVQKSIREFQQEIDTFITAVDNDGKKYSIELNAKGTLQVPISDDLSENSLDSTEAVSCTSHPATTFSQDFMRHADGAFPVSVKKETFEKTECLPPLESANEHKIGLLFFDREQKELRSTHRSSLHAARRKTSVEDTENEKSKPLSFSSKKKNGVNLLKKQKKKKTISSHGGNRFDLSPAEDARVSEILCCDDDAVLKQENNPFVLPNRVQERFSQVENSLSTLRRIREVFYKSVKHAFSPAQKEEPHSSSENVMSSSALGKKYMEEVKEKQKMRCALSTLNAKLIAYQHESEALSLELSESVSMDVRNLRPRWAQNPIQLASDEEVMEIIQQAKIEEEESKKYFFQCLQCEARSSDTSFLDRVKAARTHAELLLEKNIKEPLNLTDFSLPLFEQSSGFFETEEAPPNIRADLLDAM